MLSLYLTHSACFASVFFFFLLFPPFGVLFFVAHLSAEPSPAFYPSINNAEAPVLCFSGFVPMSVTAFRTRLQLRTPLRIGNHQRARPRWHRQTYVLQPHIDFFDRR